MDNLTPEQIELRRIMGPRRGGPNATRLMKMVVHFPTYMNAIRSLGARTADNNSLPPRLYQIACMRTSWLCDAEYLWSQHRTASLALGITDEELHAVAVGPTNTVLKAWTSRWCRRSTNCISTTGSRTPHGPSSTRRWAPTPSSTS